MWQCCSFRILTSISCIGCSTILRSSSGCTRGITDRGIQPPGHRLRLIHSEALIQGLFLVGIVFLLPLHYTTLIAVLMTMTAWAVVNHLGLELLPLSFPHHWLGRWCIGPAHHSIHHRKYNLHYGLYFTFWDKLLGTHDPSYEQTFDASLRRF